MLADRAKNKRGGNPRDVPRGDGNAKTGVKCAEGLLDGLSTELAAKAVPLLRV